MNRNPEGRVKTEAFHAPFFRAVLHKKDPWRACARDILYRIINYLKRNDDDFEKVFGNSEIFHAIINKN